MSVLSIPHFQVTRSFSLHAHKKRSSSLPCSCPACCQWLTSSVTEVSHGHAARCPTCDTETASLASSMESCLNSEDSYASNKQSSSLDTVNSKSLTVSGPGDFGPLAVKLLKQREGDPSYWGSSFISPFMSSDSSDLIKVIIATLCIKCGKLVQTDRQYIKYLQEIDQK